jgi:hypothetical protein
MLSKAIEAIWPVAIIGNLDYFPAQNCALGIVGQLKAVRQCPPE